MPRQWKGPCGAPRPTYKLGAKEVVAAVESLYTDQVQPMGRVILKRVGERVALAVAAAAGQASANGGVNPDFVPCIDPKHLRKVCEKSEQLVVEPIENGEYYALIRGRPACFIDACSDQDPYPSRLWQDLSLYFASLSGDAIFLPSGRFACAQALAYRGLPCLAYRSLGELCHIVQLAITHKKILGYRDGNLVPYRHSELMEKEQCAFSQQPIAALKGTESSAPLATWVQVRTCLRSILATQNSGAVPLPNVKRLFRSKFGLELSETSLGHSRLFELLRDPRLRDVCALHLQDNKWTVTRTQVTRPMTAASEPPGILGPRQTPQAALPLLASSPLSTFPPVPTTPPPPGQLMPLDAAESAYQYPCMEPRADTMHSAITEGNFTLQSAMWSKLHALGAGSCDRPLSPHSPKSTGCNLYMSVSTSTGTTDDDASSDDFSITTGSRRGSHDDREDSPDDSPIDLERTSCPFSFSGFSLGGPEFVARSLRSRADVTRPSPELEDADDEYEAVVKNTFIHMTPSPKNRKRSQSLPGFRMLR